MRLETRITVPEDVGLQLNSEGGFKLIFKGVSFDLKTQMCEFKTQGLDLVVIYLRRNKNRVRALVKLWTQLIQKYQRNPIFRYTVIPYFCHFPISVQKVDDKSVKIFNYLGLKKSFVFEFPDASEVTVQNKQIRLVSRNDVKLGSQLQQLKNLRYHTQQKDLDRRVFKDGFLIRKTVEYQT